MKQPNARHSKLGQHRMHWKASSFHFNDFITKLVEKSFLDQYLQSRCVPSRLYLAISAVARICRWIASATLLLWSYNRLIFHVLLLCNPYLNLLWIRWHKTWQPVCVCVTKNRRGERNSVNKTPHVSVRLCVWIWQVSGVESRRVWLTTDQEDS